MVEDRRLAAAHGARPARTAFASDLLPDHGLAETIAPITAIAAVPAVEAAAETAAVPTE
jgi:hypothetical protein